MDIQFTSHEINYFKEYNQEAFSLLAMLCSHQVIVFSWTYMYTRMYVSRDSVGTWLASLVSDPLVIQCPSRTLGSCKSLPTPRPLVLTGFPASSQSCLNFKALQLHSTNCCGYLSMVFVIFAALQSKWMSGALIGYRAKNNSEIARWNFNYNHPWF